MWVGPPSLGVAADAPAMKCDRCKTPVRWLKGVDNRRLGRRRKPKWALVCPDCFDALGRPDDPVVWR